MTQNLGITQNLASVEHSENLRFWVDIMRIGEDLLDKGGGITREFFALGGIFRLIS